MSYDHAAGNYAVGVGSATVRELALSDDALAAVCDVRRVARGGPGGQHANKTASGVRLVHRSTGLVVEVHGSRDGGANRGEALRRLRVALACAVRGGADPAWLRPHVRAGRLHCGPDAASWPGVAAVLLDLLAEHHGVLAAAAAAAALTTTQLARALVSDRLVRRAADAIRTTAGLGALHA